MTYEMETELNGKGINSYMRERRSETGCHS